MTLRAQGAFVLSLLLALQTVLPLQPGRLLCALGLASFADVNCCCVEDVAETVTDEDASCCTLEEEQPPAGQDEEPSEPQAPCRCDVLPDQAPRHPWGTAFESGPKEIAFAQPDLERMRPVLARSAKSWPARRTAPPLGSPPLHLLHQVFLI